MNDRHRLDKGDLHARLRDHGQVAGHEAAIGESPPPRRAIHPQADAAMLARVHSEDQDAPPEPLTREAAHSAS